MKAIEFREALRMFRRARRVRKYGFHRYDGSAEDICRQIIADCWNDEKQYLQVSTGHFCEFYVRDFAHCAEALVKLGYKKQVAATLKYALETFKKHGQTEQTISPSGVPFSFPAYSPDALALLLRTIIVTKQERLAKDYRRLLQKECDRFIRGVIDKKTLLPKRRKRFSGMRDHAERSGACYEAVMMLLVAKLAPQLKLKFPYSAEQLIQPFLNTYWNGSYFYSDTKQQAIVVGDANVMPFWTGALNGLISDAQLAAMRRKTLRSLRAASLDDPWPLRYTTLEDTEKEKVGLHFSNLLAKGYQTDSIWQNIGLCYLDVLAGGNRKVAKRHLRQIGRLIEEHGTFLEIYDKTGKPFATPFYITDEGMLWCAQWLALQRVMLEK